MVRRYDFHIHSLLTEGELLPSEIVQRCSHLGYGGIAITDHVDRSNLKHVLECLVPACEELNESLGLTVLAGVELTHVHPGKLDEIVKKAQDMGAQIVAVHGETIVEPVRKGTNKAALQIPGVDILAHPGLLSEEEAVLAKKNGVFLELSSRKGHCLTNGHVATRALNHGAGLLLNSDAHSPDDLISLEMAMNIAAGCGLSKEEVKRVLFDNPKRLLNALL